MASRLLPKGFHRIRHYGLLASGSRANNLATMRILIAMAAPASKRKQADNADALAAHRRLSGFVLAAAAR